MTRGARVEDFLLVMLEHITKLTVIMAQKEGSCITFYSDY